MHAVLNWLWQGSVVALALFAMLGLLERARANVRYIVCWAAQLLVLALPLATWFDSSAVRPVRLPRLPVDAVVSVPDAWWSSALVMAGVWLAWVSVAGVRFSRAVRGIRRARARSASFPNGLESSLRHWQSIRHAGRPATIVVSDRVSAAAVLTCGPPMIAVAPALVAGLEADELDRVVVHEWAHVQRRDDLVNLLQIAVRVAAGWNPEVWWIDRRLQAEREVACDEATVAITGAPKSYAACLVKLAELKGAARAGLAAPALLNVGGLRARVTRIVSADAFLDPRRAFGFAAGIAATLLLVSVAAAQTRLVEQAVFVVPYESVRSAVVRFERPVPIALPLAAAVPAGTARSRVSAPTARPAPAPVPRVDTEARAAETPTPQAQPPATPPPAAAVEPAGRPQAPVETAGTPAPTPSVSVPATPERSPWGAAADGGKTLGKKSKDAGVATAGAFSRFARRVAGSF